MIDDSRAATANEQVLIVDDDPSICLLVDEILAPLGLTRRTAARPDEALELLKAGSYDILIADFHMPGMNGLQLIAAARELHPAIRCILMSALDARSIVSDQVPTDIYDFCAKPLNAIELRMRVRRAVRETVVHADGALRRRDDMLVGSSPAMREVLNQVRVATQNDMPVLLGGESGTGKELVARTIHQLGTRYNRAFVAVNCSAIPETLIEGELFGHVRGAFTGATRDREGLFAAAEGGTIFLDEIAELPLSTQATLLRVLEQGEYRRVGESGVRYAQVRLLSATNRDLNRAVAEGRFREDLLYRINVFVMTLPPLRERREDIPMLVNHLLRRHARDGDVPRVDRAALMRLMAHDWPGNVRELENILRQAIALADDGIVSESAIRFVASTRKPPLNLELELPYKEAKQRLLAAFDYAYIANALRTHGGNVSAAARACGMHRKNFWGLMQKAGLKSDDYRS